MKASETLIKLFLDGVLTDIRELFPELDFSAEQAFIEDSLAAQADWVLVPALSSIGKAIDLSLISGCPIQYDSEIFPHASGASYPAFLSTLFEELFREDGTPLYHSHSEYGMQQRKAAVVMCLRQFFLGLSKLSTLDCQVSEESEIDAFKQRVTRKWTPNFREVGDVVSVARLVLRLLFEEDDHGLCAPLQQFSDNTFGCHGPGAVYDGSRGRDKWVFDSIAGLPDMIYRGHARYLPQAGNEVKPSCRLAIVPKDFRGHRLICVEPKEFMFYQQGLMKTIVHVVHSHWLTSDAIDFNDQTQSFKMSKHNKYATIDLSDASDNLRLSLARLLFPKDLLKLATRARSRTIDCGDEVIEYTTLFTMGNGLCFPFQTVIFYSLVLASILCKENKQHILLSPMDFKKWFQHHRIRVFGDDIIIPKGYFDEVCCVLSLCGLKVNHKKSCCDTPVREACGSWYYYGIDTRIIRLRSHVVTCEKEWCGLLASAKLLFQNGFTRAGSALLSYIHSYIPVPYGIDWLPGQINWSSGNVRWNIHLQRVECRIPLIKDERADVLTGDVGLYYYFVGKGSRMAPHHSAQRTEWGWVDRI